jgi:hypothetical protein
LEDVLRALEALPDAEAPAGRVYEGRAHHVGNGVMFLSSKDYSMRGDIILQAFNGHRVRVTVEDLGPSGKEPGR